MPDMDGVEAAQRIKELYPDEARPGAGRPPIVALTANAFAELRTLKRMRKEATETEERCVDRAEEFDGKKTAIVDKAREVKREATEMMRTYLGDDADALDGFEFLTMAEAGEAGHWSIVEVMSQRARDARTSTLAAWAKPIQERHFQEAKAGSLALAKNQDPNAPE